MKTELYKKYNHAIKIFDYLANETMLINEKTIFTNTNNRYKHAFFYLYPQDQVTEALKMSSSALRKSKINIYNIKPMHILLFLFMFQYSQKCSHIPFSTGIKNNPRNMLLKILIISKQYVNQLYRQQTTEKKKVTDKNLENYLQKITLFTSAKIIHLMFTNIKLIENVNFITQKDNFTNFIQDIINNVDIVDLNDFDNKGNLIKSTEIDNLYDTEINLAFSIIASGYFFEKDDEYNRFYQLAENYNIFCDVMK